MCSVHLQRHSEWGKESCLVTYAVSKDFVLVMQTGSKQHGMVTQTEQGVWTGYIASNKCRLVTLTVSKECRKAM